MGVGDVSLPLCDAVIKALHKAVDDQANAATFHGYMPEILASGEENVFLPELGEEAEADILYICSPMSLYSRRCKVRYYHLLRCEISRTDP